MSFKPTRGQGDNFNFTVGCGLIPTTFSISTASPQGQQSFAAGTDHVTSLAQEICIVKPERDPKLCKFPHVGTINNRTKSKPLTP